MKSPLASEAQRRRQEWPAAPTEQLGPTHAHPTGAAAIMNLLTALLPGPQSSNGFDRDRAFERAIEQLAAELTGTMVAASEVSNKQAPPTAQNV
jgi:hypothetical protein